MIFTGKINAKNSMMFDIKHLVGMPLSKREIVFLKSLADTFQMLPIALVFLYGVYFALPQYHIVFIAIMLFLAIAFGNIIAFNKRIDFSRMQHSKASFKNSFLYLHKYLEMFIQIILTIVGIALIISIFDKNIFMQEYGFFILLIVALFLAASNTLKMLKDETMSYFIFKRDVSRIVLKLLVVVIPLFAFHKIYKGEKGESLKKKLFAKNTIVDTLKSKLDTIENLTNRKFMLYIVSRQEKELENYIKDGKTIPWETHIMGHYPVHIGAATGNKKIVALLLKQKPEMINQLGKFKKSTPIYAAINACNLDMMDYLVKQNADLNHVDSEGNTPLIVAAQKKCYGGVIMLKNRGADVLVKNIKGDDVYDYIGKKTGIAYLLGSRKISGKKVE
jgi:hypothetical protein